MRGRIDHPDIALWVDTNFMRPAIAAAGRSVDGLIARYGRGAIFLRDKHHFALVEFHIAKGPDEIAVGPVFQNGILAAMQHQDVAIAGHRNTGTCQ